MFHLLYDWLLVLLQERLLSPQGAHGATAAWHQLLWVGAIMTLLLLLSTINLIWSVLKNLSIRGELDHGCPVIITRDYLWLVSMVAMIAHVFTPLYLSVKTVEKASVNAA